MTILTVDYIKNEIVNSMVIYQRGENIYRLGNYMQMATGKPLVPESDSKKIRIDRETGEVVIRFKIPVMGV